MSLRKKHSPKSPSSSNRALSPRSAPDTSRSSYNVVIKEEIRDLEKKEYPRSVLQFIRFIKIYRNHGTETRKDILEDDEVIKKITKDMISTFSRKKLLRETLADEFIKQGIQEDELKHFGAILLNKKVNEHLKKDKANATLLEDNIEKLCSDIKEKMKRTIVITPSTPRKKENDDPFKDDSDSDAAIKAAANPFVDDDIPAVNAAANPFDDDDIPAVKAGDNPFDDMTSDTDSPPPITVATKIAPHAATSGPPASVIINSPRPIALAFVYSKESETADKQIDVILSGVKVHLERLKEQAQVDPLKKNVYYEVDNLYSQCHTAIKAQQRTSKDPTHQSILQANECVLLKELDLVLLSVYKPNDVHSVTPEQFGQNILDKRMALQKYDQACKQRQLPETLGKIAVAVGIALAVTVGCAVLGALAGFLATAWTGPGAAVGAFNGLFIGGSIGWAEGIVLGSAVMGITFSTIVSKFWLFNDSDTQKQINAVRSELTNIVENENKLRLTP